MATRIERILWGRKNLHFPDFIRIHKASLPKLVMVKQSSNKLLEHDQVLCIAKVTTRVRFIATDSEKRSYSIPDDYPIKVQLFRKGQYNEGRNFSDVVVGLSLPAVVKFVTEAPHSFQWSDDGTRISLDKVTIERKCEQEFVFVYRIINGMVDGCMIALPKSENVLLGVAQGFGTSDVLQSDWLACLKVLGTISEEWKDVPTCLSEILAVSEKGLTDSTRMLIPLPRASQAVVYPQIKLADKLPPEPPPDRPEKAMINIIKYDEMTWSKKDYSLRDFYDTFCDNLPQIVMVSSGVYGLTDIETFGAGEIFRIQTYARQTRVIAMEPNETYMSIPQTYSVKMEVIESPGKYSKPYTLEEIINKFSLPCRVRFVEEGARFRNKADAYQMKELELQDTYKETYFLCNAIYRDGGLNTTVVVMPVYVEISVEVAEGYEDKTQPEWIEYIAELEKIAGAFNFNIPAPNKKIAVYSPGQMNAGENIYEYIVPNSFVTLSETEDDTSNYEEPVDPPLPRNALTLPRKPGQNQYVKLPKPAKSAKKPSKSPFSPIPMGSLIGAAAPIQVTRDGKPNHPSPTTPISPLTRGKGKQAIVPPFQYTPSKPSRPSRSHLTNIGQIPPDVKDLTVEEVCDCMKLLNLGEFVDATRKLQIDGSLLKEFKAEDYQNDPSFKMSVTQSKMLECFAKDGWRPKHN